MNTGKGKKGRNGVWEGGGQRGERKNWDPPNAQQKEAFRRVGRERGWEEGKDVELEFGSEKIPVLLHAAETS